MPLETIISIPVMRMVSDVKIEALHMLIYRGAGEAQCWDKAA